MSKSDLKILLNEKLNIQDTENQTYGCKANNPDLCKKCPQQNGKNITKF